MRIFLLGYNPLPFENVDKNFAPGKRTWQFIEPLLRRGHDVCACCSRIPFVYKGDLPSVVKVSLDNFTLYSMEEECFTNIDLVNGFLQDFEADAIIGVNVFPSSVAAQLPTTLPMWLDLYGHAMAEAQAKSFRYQDNFYLHHFWEFEKIILDRGDKFSTVSNNQKYATIGELGVRGRLNKDTAGYDFVHTIPAGIEPEEFVHDKNVLRGKLVDLNDFVVLWSGGYNTWTDVDTLYNGLTMAMEKEPSIKFVSTGGTIDGHDTITYDRLSKLVKNSSYHNNFLLLGWVPGNEVHNYYFEADVGLVVDSPLYEGVLGSKTRILDWIRAGLPCIATDMSEITCMFKKQKLGYVLPPGDPVTLKNLILELFHNRDDLELTGQKSKEFGFKFLSFQETTLPLLEWIDNPSVAPDFGTNVLLFHDHSLEIQMKYQKLSHHAIELSGQLEKLRKEIKALKTKIPLTKDNQDLPLVSIVIVYYKGQRFLHKCLDSIEKNIYTNYEVVVINNNGEDSFITETARIYPWVKIIPTGKNIGYSKANNLGIKHVNGDILVFLNQDTEVSPEWLQEIVKAIQSDEKIGIVGCKIYGSNGKILQHAGGNVYGNALTNHVGYGKPDNGEFNEICETEYVTGASLAITRKALEQVKGFDPVFSPGYYEDTDLCLAVRANGYKVVYVPSSKLIHHESSSFSKFSENFFYFFHRSRLCFVLKNYTLTDIFNKFLPLEYVWIRDFVGPDQIKSLRHAYLEFFFRLPCLLVKRLYSKKISDILIRFGHPQVFTNGLGSRKSFLLFKLFYLILTHPRKENIISVVNKHT